jgi:hypothetical protein
VLVSDEGLGHNNGHIKVKNEETVSFLSLINSFLSDLS